MTDETTPWPTDELTVRNLARMEGPNEVANLLQRAQVTEVSYHQPEQPEYRVSKNNQPVFPVQCEYCREPMLWTNVRKHMLDIHGVKRSCNQAYYQSIRYYGEYKVKMGRRPGRTRTSMQQQTKMVQPQPLRVNESAVRKPAPKVPKLDKDDLIKVVLNAIYPKGIPVDDYRAVTRWTQATEIFLEEVGQ